MTQGVHDLSLSAVPRGTVLGRNGGEPDGAGPLGSARTPKQVRRAGFVPGILYGHGVEPFQLAVNARDFGKLLPRASSSTLVTLTLPGAEPRHVLIQEVQRNPITGEPSHVDFHQVKLTEKIRAKVPLKAIGVSPAVKDQGGILVQSIAEVEVSALPQSLPGEITVDLTQLRTFEDRITVADLQIPADVELHGRVEDVVAVVASPRSEEELKAELETPVETAAAAEVKTEAEVKKAAEEVKKAEGEKAEGTRQHAKGSRQ